MAGHRDWAGANGPDVPGATPVMTSSTVSGRPFLGAHTRGPYCGHALGTVWALSRGAYSRYALGARIPGSHSGHALGTCIWGAHFVHALGHKWPKWAGARQDPAGLKPNLDDFAGVADFSRTAVEAGPN